MDQQEPEAACSRPGYRVTAPNRSSLMLTLMCIDIRNMRSGEGVSTARTGSKQDPKYHLTMKIFIDKQQVPNLQRL